MPDAWIACCEIADVEEERGAKAEARELKTYEIMTYECYLRGEQGRHHRAT